MFYKILLVLIFLNFLYFGIYHHIFKCIFITILSSFTKINLSFQSFLYKNIFLSEFYTKLFWLYSCPTPFSNASNTHLNSLPIPNFPPNFIFWPYNAMEHHNCFLYCYTKGNCMRIWTIIGLLLFSGKNKSQNFILKEFLFYVEHINIAVNFKKIFSFALSFIFKRCINVSSFLNSHPKDFVFTFIYFLLLAF